MSEPLLVGDYRESIGRTVTPADLMTWAGLVHDFTRLHVDGVHMASTPFGQPIAHGYVALNWAVGLMFPDHADWYSPGGEDRVQRWKDVRFLAPVFVGDTLTCRRSVLECVGGETHFQVDVTKQDGTVVVSGIEVLATSSEGPS